MNCLVCGHKLAIFRKLSLGDFCCQEHRALFAKQQSDRGLERLMETRGQSRPMETRSQRPMETPKESRKRNTGARMSSRFVLDEVLPVQDGLGYVGHGPLA